MAHVKADCSTAFCPDHRNRLSRAITTACQESFRDRGVYRANGSSAKCAKEAEMSNCFVARGHAMHCIAALLNTSCVWVHAPSCSKSSRLAALCCSTAECKVGVQQSCHVPKVAGWLPRLSTLLMQAWCVAFLSCTKSSRLAAQAFIIADAGLVSGHSFYVPGQQAGCIVFAECKLGVRVCA